MLFEVRTNTDNASRRWDGGKPIGWVVTGDGDWPFFSLDERDDIVITLKAEESRLEA